MAHSFPATFGPLEIDPGTKLPKIPEGFEWHVKRPQYHDPKVSLMVSLQLHYEYFHDKEVPFGFLGLRRKVVKNRYTKIFNDCSEVCYPTENSLQNAARTLYFKASNRVEQQHRVTSVLGVYPPKALLSILP